MSASVKRMHVAVNCSELEKALAFWRNFIENVLSPDTESEKKAGRHRLRAFFSIR
ncbi:hypothetical protein [Paenibacillus sacheonensis]|uniref:Uncharacterized protein n=1 Tax=Paenibacillus sacheonensis TaxID=742054 RepID=A0A7X4YL87_9BACL|nr:hypothetical protein [Paenibacillus sacheonensis]MBM7568724.1 hypothetical protein [Paenibacillus sacheonensis]NBC68438.1 hypothetical protein [Paenibacillus sacheonensis]